MPAPMFSIQGAERYHCCLRAVVEHFANFVEMIAAQFELSLADDSTTRVDTDIGPAIRMSRTQFDELKNEAIPPSTGTIEAKLRFDAAARRHLGSTTNGEPKQRNRSFQTTHQECAL